MTQPTQHIVNQIKERINTTRRALYRQELFTAVLKTFSVIGLIGTLVVFIESLAEFNSHTRTILFYLSLIFSTAIGIWLMRKPILRFLGMIKPHSDREVARMIGVKFEKIADRLENALDLSDMLKNDDTSSSPELIEVALEHFDKSTTGINFSNVVSFTQLQSLARTVSIVGTTIIILAVIPGTPFHDAFNRVMNYDLEFIPKQQFSFSVTPGNIDIVKGESVTIQATIISEINEQSIPKTITLLYSENKVDVKEHITLRPDSSGQFRHIFPLIKESMEYQLSIEDGITSDKFSITVGERPFIRSLGLTIVPPIYTKLKKEVLEENIGDVLVLPGTTIIWNIVPSKEISAATIVFKDGTNIPLEKNEGNYSGEFSALNPTSYYIELEDAGGNTNQNIIEYKIDLLTDEFPSIVVVSPGKNIDVTDAMQLPLELKIDDDFGINKLQLSYRLAESKFEKSEKTFAISIPFDTINTKNEIVNYLWDLSSLGLVPEDVIEYYAEVQDNDGVNGPKTTKSQTYLIRLPSLEEVFADADNAHEDALTTLEESLKDAQELKKDLEELSKDMKRNQQMDWQKQKKAEEALKKYEEIQKKVDNVSQSVDEMAQNLQQNNTLSKETLEKYMELQKTLSELNSPEFQKAMKRMQEAMQNVSPDQLQEAMQQAQFNEEQFRQSIERTMNLLKRIQIEQKVDELLKRVEEMKQAQENVNKETQQLKQNNPQKAAELAQKQDEINKQLSDVQKELNDLEKKMEEFPKEMPTDKLNSAQDAANDKDMQNAMKQSSQQLRSQQMEQAMSAQQQANSGISKMQQELSELQEQMLNNQMQQTMNALRKSMQDMLQLSQKQEALKNQSRSLDPNSQQFKEIAQQQQNLQGDLNNIANAITELSQQSFVVTPEMGKQIGKAMAQMQQAMSGIEQRNGQSASASQNEAMASLNKAATQMQGAMKQMQQQGGQGGGSLMQQLRNMAMQQQQINAQTQQMGQQEGMSQQQMQEMGRLARQQDAVRKSLEQLQRESQGSPEKNKVMGDLDKIADEMKEVVEQLRQNEINPNTTQQQERILSRLLQAQRSMRERDFEQKRKATTGITLQRNNPVELSAQTNESQLQKDIQRAQEAGYSKDYMDLIRKYYEVISKSN
ncbi:MAG: hypothetical protein Q8L88_15515 [Bacteroidota bacterium]|nr:hypothetical protein [Bacteroidota bacterium]